MRGILIEFDELSPVLMDRFIALPANPPTSSGCRANRRSTRPGYRDGMLWTRRPGERSSVHQDKVSLTSIASTVPGPFGVEAPSTMRGEALGILSRPIAV